jgi:hypothetical protein
VTRILQRVKNVLDEKSDGQAVGMIRIRHVGRGYNEPPIILRDGTLGIGLIEPGEERDVPKASAARLIDTVLGQFEIVPAGAQRAPAPPPRPAGGAKAGKPRERPTAEAPRTASGKFAAKAEQPAVGVTPPAVGVGSADEPETAAQAAPAEQSAKPAEQPKQMEALRPVSMAHGVPRKR